MRVYVAAPFEECLRARAVMARLRAGGCTIAYDWTASADEYPTDAGTPWEVRVREARKDLAAVVAADVVVALTVADRAKGCGMWWECGAALAAGVPIVISGPQRDRSVFCELALQVADDDAALAVVLRGELGARTTALGGGA